MKRWVVVHEIGAPSHYAALRQALERASEELEFVELNFWSQAKSIIRRRGDKPFRKACVNLWRLLQFAFDGARGRQVVLGMAPYNPWLLPVRWLLRNAEIYLHSSWPYWDGSKQPHAALLPAVKNLWQSFMTKDVRHVLIATHLAKTNLERSRYGGAPVTVVAHSYDARSFHAGDAAQPWPQRLVYVGRIEVSKGIDLILEIAARLPHFEVVIIGGGPLQGKVRTAALRLPNLRFLGTISDRQQLADELRRCQVLLLPSIRVAKWEELFGMVLIEAMACGLVPLTTDHVGPLEIMGPRLRSLCYAETAFVEGACSQLGAWQRDPATYRHHRSQACEIAAQYTRERIAERWARALNIGSAQSRPAQTTQAASSVQAAE